MVSPSASLTAVANVNEVLGATSSTKPPKLTGLAVGATFSLVTLTVIVSSTSTLPSETRTPNV